VCFELKTRASGPADSARARITRRRAIWVWPLGLAVCAVVAFGCQWYGNARNKESECDAKRDMGGDGSGACVWAVEARNEVGILTEHIPVTSELFSHEALWYVHDVSPGLKAEAMQNFVSDRVIKVVAGLPCGGWIDTGISVPTRAHGQLRLFWKYASGVDDDSRPARQTLARGRRMAMSRGLTPQWATPK